MRESKWHVCRYCLKKRAKKYNFDNKNIIKQKTKNRRMQLKLKSIEIYSNGTMRCECCCESKIEFLTIDHKNGDGAKFRKEHKLSGRYELSGGNLHYWLKRNNYPKNLGLRVLCFNCNCSIGFYGYCPHVTSSDITR